MMFYLLIIVGCVFIILGIFLDDPENIEEKKISSYKEVEELYLLQNRIEDLERIILEDASYIEDDSYMEDEIIENSIEDSKKTEEIYKDISNNPGLSYGLEKYNLLLEYESKGYSLEEICNHLNMNKGEVLLLKGLYKNHSNQKETF